MRRLRGCALGAGTCPLPLSLPLFLSQSKSAITKDGDAAEMVQAQAQGPSQWGMCGVDLTHMKDDQKLGVSCDPGPFCAFLAMHPTDTRAPTTPPTRSRT